MAASPPEEPMGICYDPARRAEIVTQVCDPTVRAVGLNPAALPDPGACGVNVPNPSPAVVDVAAEQRATGAEFFTLHPALFEYREASSLRDLQKRSIALSGLGFRVRDRETSSVVGLCVKPYPNFLN